MSTLRPVAALDSGDPVPWWPVPSDAPFRVLVLDGRTPPLEIGALVGQLARACRPESAPEDDARVSAAQAVGWILAAGEEWPMVPGGLRVEDGAGVRIDPGCCADLDDWRERTGFRDRSPAWWLGHDPDPWVEYRETGLRVHPRGGLEAPGASEPASSGFVEFSYGEMPGALESVRRDLLAFLDALGDWARGVVPDQAAALAAALDQRIGIGPPLA
ncbi:hypothetical protein KDL01_12025 [Actinospica durhamensis]|uniref:Uncharacterized protein n=1 Tax=Actinospica durhamensis TaxID=1508375 RepID=A0A941IQA3_9ACTN|nr:hypothetical protein [Actinospica durhamensis]MBR7833997.1 hypothetical protein [Actinospica durhamensis]